MQDSISRVGLLVIVIVSVYVTLMAATGGEARLNDNLLLAMSATGFAIAGIYGVFRLIKGRVQFCRTMREDNQ